VLRTSAAWNARCRGEARATTVERDAVADRQGRCPHTRHTPWQPFSDVASSSTSGHTSSSRGTPSSVFTFDERVSVVRVRDMFSSSVTRDEWLLLLDTVQTVVGHGNACRRLARVLKSTMMTILQAS